MFGPDDVLDFAPIHISSIVNDAGVIVVKAPSQPCYSQTSGEGPWQVPVYCCEMHVYAGSIKTLSVNLPFDTEDWTVDYEGGSRGFLLPWVFEAEGPIRLAFFVGEDPKIEIVGERFALHVTELVGQRETRNAT